jgi:integrase/recombinase XerD
VKLVPRGCRHPDICRTKQRRRWSRRGKYREVPVNATAREALEEWIDELPEGSPWLFPSRKDQTNGDGEREVQPITVGTLEDVSCYDLPRRFGHRMAERTALHRLAQIMGHDSLGTTMVYVRGTRGDLQQAIEEGHARSQGWAKRAIFGIGTSNSALEP